MPIILANPVLTSSWIFTSTLEPVVLIVTVACSGLIPFSFTKSFAVAMAASLSGNLCAAASAAASQVFCTFAFLA